MEIGFGPHLDNANSCGLFIMFNLKFGCEKEN